MATVATLGVSQMKVGDLVEYNGYIGIIIESNEWGEILVQWCDDEEIEDVSNYPSLELQVIS